jgi:hypothetical protein
MYSDFFNHHTRYVYPDKTSSHRRDLLLNRPYGDGGGEVSWANFSLF